MSMEPARRRAVVMQPDEGPSYWQPIPANGHSDPKLFPANTAFDRLAMGYQTIAPGSRVREHSHGDQVELQICFRGRGHVLVDGVEHRLEPGHALRQPQVGEDQHGAAARRPVAGAELLLEAGGEP